VKFKYDQNDEEIIVYVFARFNPTIIIPDRKFSRPSITRTMGGGVQ